MSRPNRLLASGLSLVAVVLAAGCCHPYADVEETYSHHESSDFVSPMTSRRADPRPSLGLSDAEVATRLATARDASQEKRRLARERLLSSEPIDIDRLAQLARDLYAAGERKAVEELATRHRGLATWEHADSLVSIDCHYAEAGVGGSLELTLHRLPGVGGTLAICFPPGTYGAPTDGWTDPEGERRYGHWPSAQELGLLQAPVIVIPEGEEVATSTVPIACASFERHGPADHQSYTLKQFEPGSPADQLLVAICSGDAATVSEAQLALWLARNDISWEQFVDKGGARGCVVTFTLSPVLPGDASGAASLLLRSGVDASHARFFAGQATVPSDEAAPGESPPPVHAAVAEGAPGAVP